MAMEESEVAAVRGILGCKVEGFPQTYLGPPLSCVKLKIGDFNPLIAKIDKYLSGWRALLPSSGGAHCLAERRPGCPPSLCYGRHATPNRSDQRHRRP
jgi:hypothetical protein